MVSGEKSTIMIKELLFVKIFNAFRMAIQPTKFIITFAALCIICLLGRLMDINPTVIKTDTSVTELEIFMEAPSQFKEFIDFYRESSTSEYVGVFFTIWVFTAERFQGMVNSVFALDIPGVANNIADFFTAARWLIKYHIIYCFIFFAVTLVVFSIAGGAICRIAALQVAKSEKPGLTAAIRYSCQKFTSYLTAPLAPVVIFGVLGAFILILGLLGNIPRAGELLMSLGLPIVLIVGIFITVVVIGTFAGFNLMFPAVAYDGSDCFDAISRSFSYVYARPWWMLFYTATAMVYGSICYTFMRFFAFLTLWITRWLMSLALWTNIGEPPVKKIEALWPEPELFDLTGSTVPVINHWTEAVAVFIIHLSVLAVIGLVVSFIINFFFSANTIIYSLMRYRVDKTPIEDIYIPADTLMDFSKISTAPTEQEQTQQENPAQTDTQPEDK